MNHSSGEAVALTMDESNAGVTALAPLVCRRVEESQEGAQGVRRRRTEKARLFALEAEINELRAWKAQMVGGNPSFPTNTATRPEEDQRGVPARRESMTARGGEEPVLPRSQLELGDLRHSLQACREGQRYSHGQASAQKAKAPSGTSTMPRACPAAKDKEKGIHTAHAEAETTA